MIREHYCLDDVSFEGILDQSENPADDIRALIDVGELIIEAGATILAPSSLENTSIGKDLLFQDIYTFDFSLSEKYHGIDRDLFTRLLLLRHKLQNIDIDAPFTSSLFDSTGACSRIDTQSYSAGVIFDANIQTEFFVLLLVGCNGPASGEHDLRKTGGSHKTIYAIRNTSDYPRYHRWLIQKYRLPETDFFSLWESSFPFLIKSDDLSFRGFHGSYNDLLDNVLLHLSFLNDNFLEIWRACNKDYPCTVATAKSGYGIDFSNESSKTRRSAKKMRQRLAKFSEEKVSCELHTKIHPQINRIHFHPPITEINPGKILVGIFTDHLET